MARRDFKGGAPQLALNGNIAASGVTTINTTGTVTAWPSAANGKFLIVIDKGLASEEKIFCSGRTVNALSVASDADRGADGTSATSHTSGATINHVGGAIDLDESNAHINDTTLDAHTQYMKTDGTRHDLTARHAFGAALGTPAAASSVDPAVAAGAGVNGVAARADHIHSVVTSMPRGSMGYAEATANQNLTTSQADVTTVTSTVTVPSGSRRIKVTVYLSVNNINAQTVVIGYIMEGATQLKRGSLINSDSVSAFDGGIMLQWVGVPSAAAHTYKAQAKYAGGAAALNTATSASFILVEDIGV